MGWVRKDGQKDLCPMAHMIFNWTFLPLPFSLPSLLLQRPKDCRESESFLTWAQYIEPTETNSCFSGMPLFDVAN